MTNPRPLSLRVLACALFGAVAAAVGTSAQAQTAPAMAPAVSATSTDANVPSATAQKQAREIAQGDPARWFRQDPGAAASLRRLQKEMGAALQEAQGACHQLPAAQRTACMNDARATYKKDMAGAQAQVMAERR
ncbi:hypothetical protein [Massilia sp. DWR3-1-1]|uniref:hypothetical protein n=1 Tax=Massilia sp. DWR3-1-1 TaxID=2804559 RepID=UPI003CED8520